MIYLSGVGTGGNPAQDSLVVVVGDGERGGRHGVGGIAKSRFDAAGIAGGRGVVVEGNVGSVGRVVIVLAVAVVADLKGALDSVLNETERRGDEVPSHALVGRYPGIAKEVNGELRACGVGALSDACEFSAVHPNETACCAKIDASKWVAADRAYGLSLIHI